MLVKDLIAKLEKFDLDSKVMIYHENEDHYIEIYDIEYVNEGHAITDRDDIVGKVRFKFCGPNEGRKFIFIDITEQY